MNETTGIYKILSVLLSYPQQDLLDGIEDIRNELKKLSLGNTSLNVLLHHLQRTDLIELQEGYVLTFDRTPSHSLHLFEHLHGEDRSRGQAMVDLLQEYQQGGFEPAGNELPDYLPLFLEFLSMCSLDKARELLGDAIHVVAHIGHKLAQAQSPYAGIFTLLQDLCPVQAQPLRVTPVRDMDEALEKFGPSTEGMELLLGSASAVQPVHFYAKAPAGAGLKG
ncbi:nitrate reductase molybdenum cofactor assembly chaperone [Saezia sanguinis]|uniref:nitrate reductase molybdenum cofactor assembly chaperone n=1 Tax=Saezia sanguinis TaxID=1965230 RepID=UPI00304D34F1